ncbi:MAG TPA: hypothetical protein VGK49_10460, partial [Ilumatobacteraceae bacterium]
LDQSGGLCTGSNDLTAFPGSVTINDYPWGDNTGIANVNNKSDACTGAAAWEIVRVRSADGTYDQNHYIYYQYWARSFDATGEVTVFQAFSDNKLPGNCGDFMVAFDYNSSTKDVENFRTYQWNDQTPDPNCSGAGSWSVAQPAITAGDGAAGFNPDVVPAGQIANDGTFGESAIDLTSAGVLTGETCQTFTAGDVVLKTGQADGAQLIDLMHMPPIQISNCNQVDVQKTSATGVDTDDVFSYKIAQRDGLTVHDATRTGTLLPSGPAVTDTDASVNSITANITIGDTHRWSNVLAQPDYFVDELAPLPPGWQLQSIVCTYQDAFLPGKPVQTATIFPVQNPVQSFKVFPPQLGLQVPKCVITNVANTVTIVKDAQPNTAGTFSFGASLDGVAQPGFGLVDDGSGVGNSKTFVVSQRASGNFDSFFEIGADNPPFYEFDSVLCLEAGQQVGGPGDAQVTLNTSADPNQPGVDIRIAPGAPRNITCTFANKQTLQPYQIIVTPGVATNRLTDAHTFFVELRTDSDDDKAIDDPVIGATLNLTWSGPAGSAINQVNGVNVAPTSSTTCTTVAPLPPRIGGVCQVRVSSPTNVGSGSLLASYAIPSGEASDPDLPSGVDKGTTALNPTTSGGVITNYTGVEDVERIQAAGQKTWVGYLVDVEPDGTNPLNQDHTFTVTVDRTDGVTPTDAAGVTVNLTWNPGTATGSTIKTVDLPGVIQP